MLRSRVRRLTLEPDQVIPAEETGSSIPSPLGAAHMAAAEQRHQRLERMSLYLITGDQGNEVETARIVEAALEGGANVIQLRKKTMPKGEQYAIALALRRLTLLHDALLIINDHVDIAIAADADGVHLGQDDLSPSVVRELPGFHGRLIGRSTHSLEQARAAINDGVDYIAGGPVFATPTPAGRRPTPASSRRSPRSLIAHSLRSAGSTTTMRPPWLGPVRGRSRWCAPSTTRSIRPRRPAGCPS